jgi:hypothetical protein
MAEKLADREHPAYSEQIDKWELYRNAVDGGDKFINRDNLFSHRLEDSEDYEERLERAYFLNFCELIPNLYNDYIFKERIGRSSDDDLYEFRKNVDRKYNDVSSFVSKAGFFSKVYGVVHALVDAPSGQQNDAFAKLTKANDTKIYPYCTLIHPTDLVDWSLDADGKFNWVILKSLYYNDADPKKDREEQTLYKLISKDEWYIEDEDGNTPKFDEEGRETSGNNSLGFVPIVSLYSKDLEDDKIGKSLLKDIVNINRIIFNWCSCIDEQIERQTFSQLVIPDDGTKAEESESGDDPLYRISTSSIWTFPSDSTHPPSFIAPETESIKTIWNLVVDHIKEIFRIAGLLGASEDMYVSRSGRAAQMGFMSVNSSLANTAKLYEKFENEISIIAKLYINEAKVQDYDYVVYPRSFDLDALQDQVDMYFKIMERNFSSTLNKFMMKEIARRSIPLATQGIKSVVEDEIESGEGRIDSLQGTWTNIEDEESKIPDDGNPNSNLGKTFRTKNQLETEEVGHRKSE